MYRGFEPNNPNANKLIKALLQSFKLLPLYMKSKSEYFPCAFSIIEVSKHCNKRSHEIDKLRVRSNKN
jgi:hypothetical protein